MNFTFSIFFLFILVLIFILLKLFDKINISIQQTGNYPTSIFWIFLVCLILIILVPIFLYPIFGDWEITEWMFYDELITFDY